MNLQVTSLSPALDVQSPCDIPLNEVGGGDSGPQLKNAIPIEVVTETRIESGDDQTSCDIGSEPAGYEMVCLADVQPVPTKWIWKDRLAQGKLNIIVGDPGLGKSTVTLDVAATVTTGRPWPDAPGDPNEIGSVILLCAEDGLADTIRPRLDAAGADLSRVYSLNAVRRRDGFLAPFNLKTDVPRLEEAIRKLGDVKVVIIDPVAAYTGDTDDNKNGAVRGLLAPLAELADRFGVAVILVSHMNKGDGGKSAYRVMGSLAFVAAARTVWAVHRDPTDPGRRLMLRSKNNLSPVRTGLAFRIADGRVHWESGVVEMEADDALASESKAQTQPRELEGAVAFLRELLADGPVAQAEVIKRGGAQGFSFSTLKRAKDPASAKSRKELGRQHGAWLWYLLDGADNQAKVVSERGSDAGVEPLGILDPLGEGDPVLEDTTGVCSESRADQVD